MAMGRSPTFVAAMTLHKLIVYCKPLEVKSNKCVCSPGQELVTVYNETIPDMGVDVFSTEGRFLVAEHGKCRHEKVDVKRVATEIQENYEPVPKEYVSSVGLRSLWRPCERVVCATFFRHLYVKCNFCTYFTSDIGALGYQCPNCSRDKWILPEMFIAQPRRPEQPMHSVWYRSAPTSYMVTDDLESYPLSHDKEMCNASDFHSKLRKLRKTNGYLGVRLCLNVKDKVLQELGKWEDLI